MFDHVSIGVSDLKRAGRFYDAVLKPLDVTRLSDGEGGLGYGEKAPGLWLLPGERPAVDACHAAALKAGGKDNGKPGVRKDYSPSYYAAFIIDPEGYRIEAYC